MIFVDIIPSMVTSWNTTPTTKQIKWQWYFNLIIIKQYDFLIIMMVRDRNLMKIWMKLYVIKMYH